MVPLDGYESKKQTAKFTTGSGMDGGGENREATAKRSNGGNAGRAEVRSVKSKLFLPGCIFLLHAEATLVFCECKLATFSG